MRLPGILRVRSRFIRPLPKEHPLSTPTLIRAQVHYFGRVQGVGFRFNAVHIARQFSVTGQVRNLSDGRVLLIAEGPPTEVRRYLQAVTDSMSLNIESHDLLEQPATGEFSSFQIA